MVTDDKLTIEDFITRTGIQRLMTEADLVPILEGLGAEKLTSHPGTRKLWLEPGTYLVWRIE